MQCRNGDCEATATEGSLCVFCAEGEIEARVVADGGDEDDVRTAIQHDRYYRMEASGELAAPPVGHVCRPPARHVVLTPAEPCVEARLDLLIRLDPRMPRGQAGYTPAQLTELAGAVQRLVVDYLMTLKDVRLPGGAIRGWECGSVALAAGPVPEPADTFE